MLPSVYLTSLGYYGISKHRCSLNTVQQCEIYAHEHDGFKSLNLDHRFVNSIGFNCFRIDRLIGLRRRSNYQPYLVCFLIINWRHLFRKGLWRPQKTYRGIYRSVCRFPARKRKAVWLVSSGYFLVNDDFTKIILGRLKSRLLCLFGKH